VHDFNGGVQPSGLFWIVEVPDHAFRVSRDGGHAVLEAKDVCVVDSFQFGGPVQVPASVSFTVRWDAIGPRQRRGSGSGVAPTDPAAFLGSFAFARSTAQFSGHELGFSFRSDRATTTAGGFAEMGPERNGTFLD
jgi:hypothetical protein